MRRQLLSWKQSKARERYINIAVISMRDRSEFSEGSPSCSDQWLFAECSSTCRWSIGTGNFGDKHCTGDVYWTAYQHRILVRMKYWIVNIEIQARFFLLGPNLKLTSPEECYIIWSKCGKIKTMTQQRLTLTEVFEWSYILYDKIYSL